MGPSKKVEVSPPVSHQRISGLRPKWRHAAWVVLKHHHCTHTHSMNQQSFEVVSHSTSSNPVRISSVKHRRGQNSVTAISNDESISTFLSIEGPFELPFVPVQARPRRDNACSKVAVKSCWYDFEGGNKQKKPTVHGSLLTAAIKGLSEDEQLARRRLVRRKEKMTINQNETSTRFLHHQQRVSKTPSPVYSYTTVTSW